MWPRVETISLPVNVFGILRDLIHERTGLFYEDNKRDLLCEKLSAYVAERGFSSFLDFYYLLKYGPGDDLEWPRVIDLLTVNETYFYRETSQIRGFIEQILPEYVRKNPGIPVRIWCAACATGEEPLTIAMMLLESGWYDRVPIEITASDASTGALEKAQRGIYRDRAFRSIDPNLKEKYFHQVNEGWRVDPGLSARVRFTRANLMNVKEIDQLARVPFIFCRNVFIYFSDDAIAKTIEEFARRMSRPGYLFVGVSESLLKLTSDFDLQSAGDAFVYVVS